MTQLEKVNLCFSKFFYCTGNLSENLEETFGIANLICFVFLRVVKTPPRHANKHHF